jgi:hypothetical protein
MFEVRQCFMLKHRFGKFQTVATVADGRVRSAPLGITGDMP